MSATKFTVKLDKRLIEQVTQSGCRKGLHSALDYLASVSKDQVPLDQGPLMNSCYVDVDSKGTHGTVSYDTVYAVIQHERTWYRHQRGRKAKYLEDPCNDGGVQSAMIELLKRGFDEMG